MRTAQKLEIAAGIAVPVSVAAQFFLFIGYALSRGDFDARHILEVCLFIGQFGVLSLMVAAGAYYHAAERSRAAAAVMATGACALIIMSGFFAFFALAWSGGGVGARVALVVAAPAIPALMTIILIPFSEG